MEIPGLIAKENQSKTAERYVFKEELEKMQKASELMQVKNRSDISAVQNSLNQAAALDLSGQYFDTGNFVSDQMGKWIQPNGGDPYSNPYKQSPYKGPNPLTNIPEKYLDQSLIEEMRQYAAKVSSTKSEFEKLIDSLFTSAEKEQVLIDMGYELNEVDGKLKITRKLADGTVKTITNSLDDLFLREITVKFKNLLMAKNTLKLKL